MSEKIKSVMNIREMIDEPLRREGELDNPEVTWLTQESRELPAGFSRIGQADGGNHMVQCRNSEVS